MTLPEKCGEYSNKDEKFNSLLFLIVLALTVFYKKPQKKKKKNHN